MNIFHLILILSYIICSIGLMTYGFHCYIMTGIFLKRHKKFRQRNNAIISQFNMDRQPELYPLVTVQLPIYNEAEVVKRLLDSAADLDYPRNRLEIQVLDDSTDETSYIIDNTISQIRSKGINMVAVRRSDRKDFKAGALAYGMTKTKADFLCIFDSDFIIPKNFLKRSIALICDRPNVACVQGRWGHNNRDENWITKAQSVGIDGHFSAEQGARGYSDLCLNFNGTAGIWRRNAIVDAGGWSGDTLTEDLDLSYRAQLAGYRLEYDIDLECPAEIPNNITALKSQQKRWAKGSIETAKKLLPIIVKSNRLSFLQKAEAFLHLTHYFVAILMTSLFVLTLPMLIWTPIPRVGLILAIIWT